jgi:hypothetical protein
MDHQTSSNGTDPKPTIAPIATIASEPPSAFPYDPHPRLSFATPARVFLGTLTAGAVGFSLGAMQGGQMAQLRFRAEHAHKMPDSTTGWYLYHKSKNYHAMQGGIGEGFRMGAKTAFWSGMALGLESTVDRYRGCSDMFSTIVATLTVAGGFSLWRKFLLCLARYCLLEDPISFRTPYRVPMSRGH